MQAEAGLTSFPIPLTIHGVGLRPLAASDAAEYRLLVHRNAGHLGRDYAVDINADEAEQTEAFDGNPEPPVMFAIIADGNLIGRIDLVPADPPRFGLGYWVSQDHTHKGIATAAVGAAVAYARRTLAASDVYAGVSHGNTRSEGVLERNGFMRVASFDTYDRFHRALYPSAASARMSSMPPVPEVSAGSAGRAAVNDYDSFAEEYSAGNEASLINGYSRGPRSWS